MNMAISHLQRILNGILIKRSLVLAEKCPFVKQQRLELGSTTFLLSILLHSPSKDCNFRCRNYAKIMPNLIVTARMIMVGQVCTLHTDSCDEPI
jgi:hypothetical protein